MVYAPGAGTVVGVNQGYLIQGPVTINQGSSDSSDWSDASAAVKALTTLGVMLCLAGLGTFGFVLYSDQPEPGEPLPTGMPEGLPLAAGLFFAGLVLVALATLAYSMRRRPRRPFDGRRAPW